MRINNNTMNKPQNGQEGFSFIEVLVSLVLAGLVMASLSFVMGQTIKNDEVLRDNTGISQQTATLRRIILRDFQNIDWGSTVAFTSEGFNMKTSHNMLEDGPVPNKVTWIFDDNEVVRNEYNEELNYETEIVLLPEIKDFDIQVFDSDGRWKKLHNVLLSKGMVPRAVKLSLVLPSGKEVTIVERVPYVGISQ